MKTLWVDAGNGAAGDMLLAALLDAGADPGAVRAGLGGLPVEPVQLRTHEVRRHGFRAWQVTVLAPESTTHRGLVEVTGVVRQASLPTPVVEFATAAFTRLAEAEARVHGVGVPEVHFHEVGGLDAIVDVVGCGLALHDLGLLDPAAVRVVSPVAVGSGSVQAAHGRLPVPAPAVTELLAQAGAPVGQHPAQRELCTPTGAALLTTLATEWGPPPAGTLRSVGVGAGHADPPEHPNLLRVLVADSAPGTAPEPWREEPLWQVEATVDDLDPRVWPELLARLRSAGAADAWCTPALMPKGRPGQVLTVLVTAELLDQICRTVFTETTTLGVRTQPVQRRALHRDRVEVALPGGTVGVKRGYLAGELVTVQPEYAEVQELAERTGAAVTDVLAAAHAAAQAYGDS